MKRATALAWAIALHAVVLYGLSRMSWRVIEPEPSPRSVVVWLRNWPPQAPPAKRRSAPRPAPRRSAASGKTRHGKQAVAPPPPRAPSEAERSARATRRRAPRSGRAAPAARPNTPAATRGSRSGEAGGLNLEQLRHQAVASVLKQRERRQGYMTFSLRDLPHRGETRAGIPGPKAPKTDVFRYGSHESGNGLGYDKPARSKIGRWLADTCHVLTDGGIAFSFEGFKGLDICSKTNARGDLFDSVKPDYLKSAPAPAGRPARFADADAAPALETVSDAAAVP